MARASTSTSNDDSTSAKKQKNNKKVKNDPEPEPESEEEEEEYSVERVLSHRVTKKGEIKYTVKWSGYEETTEEPEENLADNEKLQEYHDEIGGKPAKDSKPASKKRKLSEAADSPAISNPKTKSRKSKGVEENGTSTIRTPSALIPPQGSWETEILSIETMEKDDKGQLWVYVLWTNGNRSRHASTVVYQKCPQKVIQFYEAHLQFNSNAPEEGDSTVKDIVQAKDEEPDDADDLGDDAPPIKGVASAL